MDDHEGIGGPLETQQQSRQNVADGIWYVDSASGVKKWLTGSMLMSHIHQAARGEARKQVDAAVARERLALLDLADAIAKRIADERAAIRAEVEALRKEMSELRDELKLRDAPKLRALP